MVQDQNITLTKYDPQNRCFIRTLHFYNDNMSYSHHFPRNNLKKLTHTGLCKLFGKIRFLELCHGRSVNCCFCFVFFIWCQLRGPLFYSLRDSRNTCEWQNQGFVLEEIQSVPRRYIKCHKKQNIDFKKLLGEHLAKNHACNPFQSSSN